MALGRQRAVQGDLLIGWHEVPTAPGHAFYDRMSVVLDGAWNRPPGPGPLRAALRCEDRLAVGAAGRYFRMLFVGYFEGLDSERGIAWRSADSLSLRHFLQLGASEAVPDHSTESPKLFMDETPEPRCSTGRKRTKTAALLRRCDALRIIMRRRIHPHAVHLG